MTGFETASLVIAGANAATTIIVAIGIWDGVRKLNQQTKESAERRQPPGARRMIAHQWPGSTAGWHHAAPAAA